MAKVAKLIGLKQTPSPTWARHSFATNLNNSGVVPYKYISDSMGHSGGSDITSNHIGAYPLAKMLEYNYYLLNEKPKETAPVIDKKALLEMLKGLSEEERMDLMVIYLTDATFTARIPSKTPQKYGIKYSKNTE